MTKILYYHPKSENLALLCSGAELWIGQYDQHLTHQNGEPPYVWVQSCSSIDRGLEKLQTMNPNYFY